MRMTKAWALLAAAGIVACTDSTEPLREEGAGGGVDASAGGTAGAAGQPDAGAGGGAGVGGTGGAAGTAGAAGSPYVEEPCEDSAAEPPIFAWAASWQAGSNASLITYLSSDPRRCQRVIINSHCSVYDCLSTHWDGTAAEIKALGAGPFKIQSSDGLPDIDLPFNLHYDILFTSSPRWKEGDLLTFSAPGDDVPGFNFSIQFPSPLVMLEPAIDGGWPVMDTTAPFAVKWEPVDGAVLAIVWRVPTTTADVLERLEGWCYFDGSSGQGEMPVELMQRFAPTDAGTTMRTGISTLHVARRCYSGIPGRQFVVQVNNGMEQVCKVQ
jgi:hypothetical protein